MDKERIGSSFRDPSGYVFKQDGVIYRQIFEFYRLDYERLISSGLYKALVENKALIAHEEVPIEGAQGYTLIRPQPIAFVSYPYEWTFGQLKDAALLTLEIARTALDHGMVLKDASAFNIQFHQGRPILIDTLSFNRYEPSTPWGAYRQFCQHFLAPLVLMAYKDLRLNSLFMGFIDGVPLDLTSRLLPFATYARGPILLHIHLHAYLQRSFSQNSKAPRQGTMPLEALKGMLQGLQTFIEKLKPKTQASQWVNYYQQTNYLDKGLQQKEAFVKKHAERIQPSLVWDMGANTGRFSKIVSQHCRRAQVMAFDMDPVCVEGLYQELKKSQEKLILPLVLNLENPTPALGWHLKERFSLLERGPAHLVLALALIHHLVIANNVPLDKLARFLADCAQHLIIEFIPKQDSQVQRLLQTRQDIFQGYHQQAFEEEFSKLFLIQERETLEGSSRVVYMMEKRR